MTQPRKLNNETPPKDNQDLYDRVCERLITHFDWGQCISPTRNCAYRKKEESGNVNCCAIGYLIPDWSEIMADGVCAQDSVIRVTETMIAAKHWFENVDMRLVSMLQQVHDQSYNWMSLSGMRRALLQVLLHHPGKDVRMNQKFMEGEADAITLQKYDQTNQHAGCV